jgi:hypothetical protein
MLRYAQVSTGGYVYVFLASFAACLQGLWAAETATPALPSAWQAAWQDPPAAFRPLQIVHGIEPRRASPEGMRYYADLGLGGIVCNVAFHEYMQNEQHWKTLTAGVEACRALGLVVWLYDEDRYPSGAAGGLVLKDDRALEAQALTFDAAAPQPLALRPAYEHTHASNNHACARRYINLLDQRATAAFIAKTHEAYWARLQPHFGKTIEAIFTDEPSLMAVNIGAIPEPARSRVPIVDPLDPAVRPLPSVPWGHDLADRYRQRYGEDLAPRRQSLFGGDGADDRRIRRQYWALVADLAADRYYGQIQQWCRRRGITSSGHKLHEESLLHHVPLDGNGLKVLGRMDIPGLDMLSSDPAAVLHGGWLTAALPLSAALHNGGRRVTTEISDFSQKMAGRPPATLDEMQAAAAWQAAWGVTEFTLYYRPDDRSADDYRAYGSFVGRLNAVLEPARPTPEVLLYYPIYDLWAEYRPVAEPLSLDSQSPRAQAIVRSFMRLGQSLQRRQTPFVLADHEQLAAAKPSADGRLEIGAGRFAALLLPVEVELPPTAAERVEQFRAAGGRVLRFAEIEAKLAGRGLDELLPAPHPLSPPGEKIVLGRFAREGRTVLLAVNVGREPYAGTIAVGGQRTWLALDPARGTVVPVQPDAGGAVPLQLAACQAVLLIGP